MSMVNLCAVADIPAEGARGFDVGGVKLFAVREYDKIYVYLNRCPHLGTPLEWQEDEFLDPDGKLIQCSTHGALFERSTGECLQGPCRGDYLWQIESLVRDGQLLIEEAALPITGTPT